MVRTREGRTEATVFLLAIVVRLLYLADSADSPIFREPIIDAGTYDALARSLLEGGTLSEGFFWQPIFYPVFLTALYALSGGAILFAKAFQAVLGALTCLLTYRLGARIFRPAIGLAAGLIGACYAPLFFFEGELLATGWEAFWACALLLLCLRLETEAWPGAGRAAGRPAALWIGFGLCGALSTLTRPTFLPFVTAAGVWLGVRWARTGGLRALLAGPAPAAAAAALLLLPVAEMNRRVTGIRSFLPYSGGLNLYVGNNPRAADTVAVRPGWDWDHLTRMPLRYGVVRREQTPGFFVDQVRQFARADPAGFLRGLADKAVQFVSARELPRNEDLYVHRQWSVMLRLLAWKAGGFGFPFGVVLPLAAVGFCWSARRLPVSVLLFLALFPAAVISVFVTSRYRIPAVPAFIILACEGAAVLGAAIRQRRWGRAGAAAGVGFAALTLACVPGPFPQEAAGYEAEMYYCLAGRASAAGDQRGAEARVRRALAIRPDYADAHNSLGVIYEKTGRLALAEQSYRQAVTLHRSNATARVNLGRLLEKNGQVEAAAGYYTEALRIDPNRPEVFDRLGIVSLRQNRFEKAVEYFCLSLTLNPNNAGAHCNLGIALKHLGRVDEAAAELAKALELDPSLTEARQVLAELGGR